MRSGASLRPDDYEVEERDLQVARWHSGSTICYSLDNAEARRHRTSDHLRLRRISVIDVSLRSLGDSCVARAWRRVCLRGDPGRRGIWRKLVSTGCTRTGKQRVFEDFIAAAEELVRSGWTRPELLTARGESNGGLLVAASAVQRPDLFRGVISEVPLTDMIRFSVFGDGASWVDEYGSVVDANEFSALLRYSPYHNIKEGVAYPAMLVTTTDTDSVVDSLHARKFVAALQHASAGGPVLFDVQGQNHGVVDRARAIESDAFSFSFALWQVGKTAPTKRP